MEVPNKCDEFIRLEVLIQKSVGLLVGNPQRTQIQGKLSSFLALVSQP